MSATTRPPCRRPPSSLASPLRAISKGTAARHSCRPSALAWLKPSPERNRTRHPGAGASRRSGAGRARHGRPTARPGPATGSQGPDGHRSSFPPSGAAATAATGQQPMQSSLTPHFSPEDQPKLVNPATGPINSTHVHGTFSGACTILGPVQPGSRPSLGRRGRSATTGSGVGITGWWTGPGQVEQDHELLGLDDPVGEKPRAAPKVTVHPTSPRRRRR